MIVAVTVCYKIDKFVQCRRGRVKRKMFDSTFVKSAKS